MIRLQAVARVRTVLLQRCCSKPDSIASKISRRSCCAARCQFHAATTASSSSVQVQGLLPEWHNNTTNNNSRCAAAADASGILGFHSESPFAIEQSTTEDAVVVGVPPTTLPSAQHRKQNIQNRLFGYTTTTTTQNKKKPFSNACFLQQFAKDAWQERGKEFKSFHNSTCAGGEEEEKGEDQEQGIIDQNNHKNHNNNINTQNQKNYHQPVKEEANEDDDAIQGSLDTSSDYEDTVSLESAGGATGKKVHSKGMRFEDLPISAESRRALKEVFKYQFMTVVQAETLPVMLKGGDCLAKAKTGTGKTLAFLIPAIEKLAQKHPNRGHDIDCLVISPTRELAFQISTEAENLTRFHEGISVVTVVGGTTISKDYKALQQNVRILVGTPGRLLDHLKNTQGLVNRLSNLGCLILDEADQLLDMGFRPDIERILSFLSKSANKRQTLLFSATVPQSVGEIARIALRPKYDFVNTVSEEEEQTHLHVEQEAVVVPHADHVHALASLLFQETTSQENYKVIVFFTTARLTGFMAELFNSVQAQTGFEVLEIHSRKNQAARQKTSSEFRTSRHAVMFSSDVSARGMDYPDVTAVIQVGLTDVTQYIHRLGRTARAGKSGHGILLLAPHEADHMIKRELKDLPIKLVDIPTLDPKQRSIIGKALEQVSRQPDLRESGEQAYRAWLGYHNTNLKKFNWDKKQLVKEANMWAKDMGLKEQPKLQKKTAGKMGLKGVPGVLLE